MKRRYTLPVLALLSITLATGIVAASCLLYRSQREGCRQEHLEQFEAVAALKVSELLTWRKDCVEDAGIFHKNKVFAALVRGSIERPDDASLQEELQTWLGRFQASNHFEQITLLDAACNERMSVPPAMNPHSALTLEQARESMRSGEMTFADFSPDDTTKRVYLRLFVPILDEPSPGQGSGRPLGVLRLRIDPEVFLYPFIQRWPAPSETAETLLIRREGDEVVYLNQLRHQTAPTSSLRMPIDRTDLPAVRAALGEEGIMEGADYRGVPVMAAMRAVPNSPWFLVAKMDAAEVYAPMRERLGITVLFVGVLLFALAAVVGFVWRHQHAAVYRKKYETELNFLAKRKEMEHRQHLSTEVLGILNESGALSDAIDRILTAIQRTMGIDAAGIRLRKGKDFPYFSQVGLPGDFLLAEDSLVVLGQDGGPCRDKGESPSLECTCGLVLSGKADPAHPLFTLGGSFWTNDSLPLLDLPAEQDPRLHPRNRCIREGFLSMALIPIRANQEIVGLLQLNGRKKDCFSLETIHFLEGISASIGAALMRKQVEEELRASESRLQAITDSAQDAILMMDPQGLISYWNPAAEAILGYTAVEAIGRNLHVLLAPERYLEDHRAAFPAFNHTGCGNAIGKTLELGAKRRDGQEITVALSLSAVSLNGAWHAVGILRDITQRKQMEEALRKSKEQADQYAAALESSNQALEEFNHLAEAATRAKSEFLANMSHEIRTPMTAILGYADILLEENAGRATCEHIKIIKRNGEHLLGLINDILDLSKVEAGKMQIEPTRCSPLDLLSEVVSLMQVRAAAKRFRLESELIGPLPETILTDPLRLRQVLVNLVGNAIKFTEQGEVRIVVQLTDDRRNPRLRFDVIDTGIGMNEEQIERLFKAFSQVDNSSARKFAGTGLGLCISKRLTEALGGKIDVRSTPGQGSTFSVTIDPGPLDGVRMIESAQESLYECVPAANKAIPDKVELFCRVLLAEDGPDNQRLIALLLKKAGADVVTVENGQLAYDEALRAIALGTPFDVILMDMQMPVMDGYTATRRLRERGYAGPIVALTAHAMAEDREKCLDSGCDDYATKPIDRQKLLATVAHWTARNRTHSGPMAEIVN